MKFTIAAAMLVATAAAADPKCYARGACAAGYMDKTNGGGNFWACGNKCAHGRRSWTDGSCNCACTKADDRCNEDGSIAPLKACLKQGACAPGYVDFTNGKGNWWACGKKCAHGRNMWTDGSCNCACRADPDPNHENCQ